MCFIISIIMLILSYNFFNAGDLTLSIASLSISIIFMFFMIQNILKVKKMREKTNDN